MIELVGDTHRELDIQKVFDHASKYEMTKENNIIIVLGDVGLVWDCSPSEIKLRNNISNRPFTLLAVDGNHENFDEIEKFPITEMFGGRVRKITNSIIYLLRGEIYEIEGKKFLAFGGALSIDKHLRLPGRSWWPQEIASYKDYENACKNLDKHNWEVDFVLSHTVPYYEVDSFIGEMLIGGYSKKFDDPTTNYLQDIKDKLKFKKWYFGHFHIDRSLGLFTCLYRQIVILGDDVKNTK